jgi:DNA-binding HxlR family transcriptional regulator
MGKHAKPDDACFAGGDDPDALRTCPVFLTLRLIANKWSIRILYFLLHAKKNTLRFGELRRQLGGITQRELTKHLREFEKSGIVDRHLYPEVPPRVEYTLTALGHSLWKPIEELSLWAEKHGAQVQKRRHEFGTREKRG